MVRTFLKRKELNARVSYGNMLLHDFKRHKLLYAMILPIMIYYLIFSYWPMYGTLIAFQNYSLGKGIWGSKWVGLYHFIYFFKGPYVGRIIRNTVLLNLYGIVFSFPVPIIFALLVNEIKGRIFKKVVQTVSYLPFFISLVIITGIIHDFCSQDGLATFVFKNFFGYPDNTNLLTRPELFRGIYVASDIWQYAGFNSIIYISALSSINPELYESAVIDGANRWKQTVHITIPGIAPTIIILFILQLGSLMSVGFDKVYLLYNETIYETADVIATYVYRQGLLQAEFSFSAAVGLFNSVVNFIILVSANYLSRKVNEVSLF